MMKSDDDAVVIASAAQGGFLVVIEYTCRSLRFPFPGCDVAPVGIALHCVAIGRPFPSS